MKISNINPNISNAIQGAAVGTVLGILSKSLPLSKEAVIGLGLIGCVAAVAIRALSSQSSKSNAPITYFPGGRVYNISSPEAMKLWKAEEEAEWQDDMKYELSRKDNISSFSVDEMTDQEGQKTRIIEIIKKPFDPTTVKKEKPKPSNEEKARETVQFAKEHDLEEVTFEEALKQYNEMDKRASEDPLLWHLNQIEELNKDPKVAAYKLTQIVSSSGELFSNKIEIKEKPLSELTIKPISPTTAA